MSSDKPSTNLLQLSFEGQNIRAYTDEHGMVWWVARDVCLILDLDNTGQALARLDEDEKSTITFSDSRSNNQRTQMVNEYGLYRLVLSSRKPEANTFKRWMLHDVLPSIRQTGRYVIPGTEPLALPDPDPYHRPLYWYEMRQITAAQVRVFTYAYDRPHHWFTTQDLRALGVSTFTSRFYCRYFSEAGLFNKIHHHPLNLYQWHPKAAEHNKHLLARLIQARTARPQDLPLIPRPDWDREDDPRKW